MFVTPGGGQSVGDTFKYKYKRQLLKDRTTWWAVFDKETNAIYSVHKYRYLAQKACFAANDILFFPFRSNRLPSSHQEPPERA